MADLAKVVSLRRRRNLAVPEFSRHLVFVGNPGTGKTTIARVIAGLYNQFGLLSSGQLIETSRSDLVAGYVGQTAEKTTEVFNSARGGVLFIDEAYTLDVDSPQDFGHEAIDTLLKLMEDHREDIVIIVAGYPVPMARFLTSNPGLKSRFSRTISFPDYSSPELVRVFKRYCTSNEYHLPADADATLVAIFDSQPRDETFGNARLARSLFEHSLTAQATRIVAANTTEPEALMMLAVEDLLEASKMT
jgi:SpoVK/Ycf46/Vps4 family AAA+-type ATPase